jgi:hypothetical protein
MRFTFVILLFCGLGADAQMIIKAHANYVPFASANLLLDQYSGAAAAYSLRKLRTAYTGSAIRVRRSNDNTEQDIGFVGNDLDTASLKTFVGANSGFVTTWYDQSTNARNATQTTAANQPRIINAGTVERIAGEPSIFFDGSNDNLRADNVSNDFTGADKPVSNYAVINKTNTNTVGNISCFGRTTNATPFLFTQLNSSARFTFNIRDDANVQKPLNSSSNTYTANTSYIFTIITTGTILDIFTNGTNRLNDEDVNVGTLTLNTFTIGAITRTSTAGYYGGYISENIIYASDNSSSRTGIETNINSYYGIY